MSRALRDEAFCCSEINFEPPKLATNEKDQGTSSALKVLVIAGIVI